MTIEGEEWGHGPQLGHEVQQHIKNKEASRIGETS